MARASEDWIGLVAGAALLVGAAAATPAAAGSACKCRYFGKFFGLGQSICIRGRVATCSLVLNNSSWQFTERRCSPSATRQSRPRSVARSAGREKVRLPAE